MGSSLLGSREELGQVLSRLLEDMGALSRMVFSKPVGVPTGGINRVTIRPVMIRGSILLQFSAYDQRKSTVRNYDLSQALTEMSLVLGMGFQHISILRTDTTVQIQCNPDGTARMTRGKPQAGHEEPSYTHDRRKAGLLTAENAAQTLSALGFLTSSGEIKPTMQKKLRQVNEFVRLVEESAFLQAPDLQGSNARTLDIVDCGCGNAYLTFALYHYLSVVLSKPTRLTGIDKDSDAVSRNNERARRLGFADLRFENQAIGDFTPPTPPDAVLSLHACDTATDDAIARGISWGSRLILCAPCCHHHLNHQLKSGNDSPLSRSLSRYGLLLERLGDVMTDAFRAQVLSVMGYRVSSIKFVDPENTERNVLLKAEWQGRDGNRKAAAQYVELKSLLKVTPYLEGILGDAFTSRLVTAWPVQPPASNPQTEREERHA